LNAYREAGYIPEGLINYLALLGWSIADDHDIFSLAEMVTAFDVADVNANPARFDPKKCEAINATHLRLLPGGDFARRLADQIAAERLRTGRRPLHESQRAVVYAAAPLVQERVATLGEGSAMLKFLLDDDFTIDEKAAAKALNDEGQRVLEVAIAALQRCPVWTTSEIEASLRTELIERLELKPRVAFGPIRVAVTGSNVSPPLFESLELLGRERTLQRLVAAQKS
jgi:glutamyl-tRNA synthetase